ncbi:MAG TPA: HAD-IIIC family phosphatase [Rhizomicrobium sp.]|nr:HAD-IIIC family phosphatase [Rhizomicrobium sp.]
MGADRVLLVDAIGHARMPVSAELARIISGFDRGRDVPDEDTTKGVLAGLIERGILTRKTAEEELQHVAQVLRPYHGRDPIEMLDRFRRESREGVAPYFAAGVALTPKDFAPGNLRIDVLLFGACDVQMEADFLRREAAEHGIDLKIAASFPHDLRLAGERKHDAILIGALHERRDIPVRANHPPHQTFMEAVRRVLDGLRAQTAKPILVDNLPEPTVQPLGLAERGAEGHRNRFRAANIALAELAGEYSDVYVVDIAAAINAAGAERLIDDGLVDYSHLGSPGWMLQRAESEKGAVHGIFPDLGPLARSLDGNPYLREPITARAHLDALATILGLDRKKCVIVDLDGLLWPGVLAETGAPFAWREDVSGPYSYVGLYFGIHQALVALKARGILLACVSKNDEQTVRELWKYEAHYAPLKLLTPDDFVTWRVNWDDKVSNIQSIADELGFAPSAFIFIDDNPVERERVQQRLPEIKVWGDNLFALRRKLLNDPRLQIARVTKESANRTETMRGQLERKDAQAKSLSEEDFIASLKVETRFEKMIQGDGKDLPRVAELFQRTTQFNTTGIKFGTAELENLLGDRGAHVFVAHVKDRLSDHGLVGAAVVRDGDITGLALSCRVLGMGVEHKFLQHIMQKLSSEHERISGRIIETSRNIPVRNLYRDNGFALNESTWWRSLRN